MRLEIILRLHEIGVCFDAVYQVALDIGYEHCLVHAFIYFHNS